MLVNNPSSSMMPNFMMLYFLVLSSCIYFASAQDTCENRQYFYVSSNGSDSKQCKTQDHPCSTLLYLIQQISATPPTPQCYTIEIMSNLTLNNTVVHIGLDNTSIIGPSDAKPVTIQCEGSSGIVLESLSNFYLQHIRFSGCSFDVTSYRKYLLEYDIPSNFTSIWINNSSYIHILGCSFENHSGSSIFLENVYYNITVENCSFTGNSSLLDNTRSRTGGIVVRLYKDIFVQSHSLFHLHFLANFRIYITSCDFNSNYNKRINDSLGKNKDSSHFGGAIDIEHSLGQSSLSVFVSSCIFRNNAAAHGGAISMITSNATFVSISNSLFTDNLALSEGGALRLGHYYSTSGYLEVELIGCNFKNNSAYWGGAVAVIASTCSGCSNNTNINFVDTTFFSNTATSSGFAVALSGPDLADSNEIGSIFLHGFFSGITNISNNKGNESGALSVDNSVIVFTSKSISGFSNNIGTAMVLQNSKAFFNGTKIQFVGNTASIGAAIIIEGDSFISFGPESSSYFTGNRVSLYGGAIYSSVTKNCTFEVRSLSKTLVAFSSNYANLLDQSIYFASADNCSTNFSSVFRFQPKSDTQILRPLHILGLAFKPEKEVMLGEEFVLRPTKMLDIYGQYSIGTGYIRFQIKSANKSKNCSYYLRGPGTISLDSYTENYTFFVAGPNITDNKEAVIDVYYQNQAASYETSKAEITFDLVPCRLGYGYSSDKQVCVCEAQSATDLFQCDPYGQTLCLKRHYWYSIDSQTTYSCPAKNCWFMYNQCPSRTSKCYNSTEYCGIKEEDDVCWEGRSGFLCSVCAPNQSFTFAAFMCTSSSSCHPWNTFLLLLALVVYWLLFIFVLLLGLSLNLSVGSGFMFGIVYFFSVATIYTRSSELYSDLWVTILLYIDIAVTLCDPELLGYVTNTCFAESWRNSLPHALFRYATPLFLILAVFLLILISRYCRLPKFLSLAESSPIHAICLLILLSYTSISWTSLKLLVPMRVEDGLRVQMAPTVSYFSSEHIPYAVVGICAELFFCLPICFLFLFAPLISKRVNMVKLRLKPIVDEFQACYKSEYRWFAGFYFSVRQVVYLVNMTLSGPFPQSNYVLTTINILILLIHLTIQPYSSKWLNILDAILLTDIVILSQSSPTKVGTITSTNLFLYNILIPYALILFPTLYLFLVLGLIFVKKILSIFSRFKCYTKLPEGRLRSFLRSVLLKFEFQRNLSSGNLQDVLSDASQDPLLDDLETERSKLTATLYGSTENRHSN